MEDETLWEMVQVHVPDLLQQIRPIIDVTMPSDPVEVGFLELPGNALRVVVSGTLAFVTAGYYNGLRIVDVSTPSAPVEVGVFTTPGEASKVVLSGGYAFVADGTAGMSIIDDCHLIFVDGFESGEGSTWSFTVP